MRLWRTPLDVDSIHQPHGEIHVLAERCKGCEFCAAHCPQGVLVMSERLNAKGYHLPEVVEPDRCVACGLCELLCPEFAIYCLETTERVNDG